MTAYWLKYRGTRFPLRRGETVIGRSPYCSIVLSNPRASRQHCVISWTEEGVAVNDLGSSNGTVINGKPVGARQPLRPGDVLEIGTDLLELIVTERRPGRGVTQTEESPPPLLGEEGHEERTNTKRQHATIELLEALAASAVEANSPQAVTASIMRTVDSFLGLLSDSGRSLSVSDATRLAAVAEIIASRGGTVEVVNWRARTVERIRRDTGSKEAN